MDLDFAKKVMKKARALGGKEPWYFLPEEQFFAIEVPGDDELWFGHFMGSLGEHQAVVFYRGVDVFRQILADIESENDELLSIFETSQYQVVWGSVFEMEPGDEELVRKLGMNRQAVTQTMLRYAEPHWIPRALWREEQFEVLDHLLSAANKFYNEVFKSMGSYDFTEPFSGQIVLYRPKKRKGELINIPAETTENLASFLAPQVLKPLRAIPQTNLDLYVSFTPAMMVLPSDDEGGPLFLASPLLLGDLDNDMIIQGDIPTPNEEGGYYPKRAVLAQTVAEILIEAGERPEKISVSDESLLRLLKPLESLAGIELTVIEEPSMRASFLDHMNEVIQGNSDLSEDDMELMTELTESLMDGDFDKLAGHPQLDKLLALIPPEMRSDIEAILKN